MYFVFDSVRICLTCKQSVVEWLRDSGIGLDINHPFAREFIQMDRARPSDSKQN